MARKSRQHIILQVYLKAFCDAQPPNAHAIGPTKQDIATSAVTRAIVRENVRENVRESLSRRPRLLH